MNVNRTFNVRSTPLQGGHKARNLAVILVAAGLVGCSAPAVRQQRLVSRPNMTFSDSPAFIYNSPRLLPQLATGFAGSGAAQNSGCTSCR